MVFLPEPEIILTHESDLDGFVSALLLKKLARKLYGLDCEIQAWNNEAWGKRQLLEHTAWVCDLTFAKRMDKPSWVVVDHHLYQDHPTHTQLIHSPDKSASLLCYELCQEAGISSPELDKIVQYSNVADLFLEKDPDFNVAMDYANLVKAYTFWKLYAVIDGELERLYNHPLLKVMEVKRLIENPIGLEWSRKNMTPINGSIAVVELAVGNGNQIVNQLLHEFSGKYSVLITLFRKTNASVVVSIRSLDGQALNVARKLGGGGHPNASGATLPRSIRSVNEGIAYLESVLRDEPVSAPSFNSLDDLLNSIDLSKSDSKKKG